MRKASWKAKLEAARTADVHTFRYIASVDQLKSIDSKYTGGEFAIKLEVVRQNWLSDNQEASP